MRTRKCRPSEPNRPRSPSQIPFGRRPASRTPGKTDAFSARHYLGEAAEFSFKLLVKNALMPPPHPMGMERETELDMPDCRIIDTLLIYGGKFFGKLTI